MQDELLLAQYVQHGSEAAFSVVIARHLPLVYRTCRRELGSDSLAEDAAQVVFLLLARNAQKLRKRQSLAGWLYQTAIFVSKNVRKQEARRLRREQAVIHEIIREQTVPALEWDNIEPLLNHALSALKPTDREAVLLRFLEGHTLAETGTLLGLSEDAARMRVTRAVEKLRVYLTAHGAAISGLALTGFLTAEAAHPIPVHAAAAITQGTLQAIVTGPTANVLLLSKGVSHTMKVFKLKAAALAASVLLAGAALPPLVHAFIPHKPAGQVFASPPLSAESSAQATETQTPPTSPAAGTQTIVLQHTVVGQMVKFLHWDQAVKLAAGVTKIEAVPAQNALAVTATPAGFAKVQFIVKQLDVEPRQVKILCAMARVSDADLRSSGIKFEVAPLTEPASNPALVVYASGLSAIQLLQSLTKKGSVTQTPDITTTNNTPTYVRSATTLPGGATISQELDVTPHVNSDNSITLVMHPRFVDRTVTYEANTTRTIKSGDTMVIVISFAASQSGEANELFFVTPTVK